jgi:guanylate kinase
MSNEHTLLLVVGRTASGKDSLVNKLCERTHLKAITSYTTRPRREKEGDTHVFATEDVYEQMQADGEVAAYTQIAGYHYWTTIEQLYDNDVYIIDYKGIQTLRELNLPNIRFVTVFINTPDDIREERALSKRKDDKLVFRKRSLDEAAQFREMLKNADFDYSISNIELPKAYSVLRWVSQVEGVWKNNLEEENVSVENSN